MTVKEYTEEFFKLSIRAGQTEGNIERVARYINGLRFDIQDEIILVNLNTIEDAYESALRVEEKILRRQNDKNRGRGSVRRFPNRGGKF